MATIANKRSVMTLYSTPSDIYCHVVRLVLAEKGVAAEIIDVDPNNKPQELLTLNPFGTLPILIDRDLVLHETNIILEYLDERFPHPPLMPVYPVTRAKCRMMMYRLEKNWAPLIKRIEQGTTQEAKVARKELLESLTSIASIFNETPFFLSEEFSLVDCYVAPILWRLPRLGIELPAQTKALKAYAKKLEERVSFKTSLTEHDRESIV